METQTNRTPREIIDAVIGRCSEPKQKLNPPKFEEELIDFTNNTLKGLYIKEFIKS